MNVELVKKIADAVLYEGYMLYPYRASSVKNRQRFNWGALVPKSYSAANKGTENCSMQTECLIEGNENSTLDIKVRFLHLTMREIGETAKPLDKLPENFTDFNFVSTLEIGGKLFQTWQEAIEREVDFPTVNLSETERKEIDFSFPATRKIEHLHNENEKIVGAILRTQKEVKGKIELQISNFNSQFSNSKDRRPQIYKLTVRIFNLTPFEHAETKTREAALLHSTVSTHLILHVKNSELISLLDAPDELKEMVLDCENIGTFPVLVGAEGEKDSMLSSPIILYDYPQIAAESAGDLFDGAEIDEILTLRIMTLTDDEKHEMRGIDDRVRQLLERTETMPEEHLIKMHGAMKGAANSQGNK